MTGLTPLTRSVQALSYTYATNSPLVTTGHTIFTPKMSFAMGQLPIPTTCLILGPSRPNTPNYPDTISRLSTIHRTDRQTERQIYTHTHTHTHMHAHTDREMVQTIPIPIPAYALLTIVSDADNNNNTSSSNNNTIHNHEVQYNAAKAATTMPRMWLFTAWQTCTYNCICCNCKNWHAKHAFWWQMTMMRIFLQVV